MALNYSYIPATNSYSVVSNSCTVGAVVIPNAYDDGVNGLKPVRIIENSAFANCLGLTSITIPSNVQRIEMLAFAGCTNLTDVTLSTGLVFIGINAFRWCGFTNINIPTSVTTIDNFAFGNTKLTNVTIPALNINYGAFSSCSDLISVTFLNTVRGIGPLAFSYTGLTSVIIPNDIIDVGWAAFSYCPDLTNIEIGSGVTRLGYDFFYQKTKYLYAGCPKLATITVSSSNLNFKSQDNILYNKSMTTLMHYPSAKTGSKFIVPNSVEKIGLHAFDNAINLTEVYFSESFKYINSYSFNSASNIKRIHFAGNAPIQDDTNYTFAPFTSTSEDLKLYRKKHFVTGWPSDGQAWPPNPNGKPVVVLWSDNVIAGGSGGIGKITGD